MSCAPSRISSYFVLGAALLAAPSHSQTLLEIDARAANSYAECSTKVTVSGESYSIVATTCDGRVVVATADKGANPFATFEAVAIRAWEESPAGSDTRWALAYCKPDGDQIRLSVGVLLDANTERVSLSDAWYLDESSSNLVPFDGSKIECNPTVRAATVLSGRIGCLAGPACDFLP